MEDLVARNDRAAPRQAESLFAGTSLHGRGC